MIDFIKIDEGKVGTVSFNNMILVTSNNYSLIKFNKENKLPKDIRDRYDNHKLLEEKCMEYNKDKVLQNV